MYWHLINFAHTGFWGTSIYCLYMCRFIHCRECLPASCIMCVLDSFSPHPCFSSNYIWFSLVLQAAPTASIVTYHCVRSIFLVWKPSESYLYGSFQHTRLTGVCSPAAPAKHKGIHKFSIVQVRHAHYTSIACAHARPYKNSHIWAHQRGHKHLKSSTLAMNTFTSTIAGLEQI